MVIFGLSACWNNQYAAWELKSLSRPEWDILSYSQDGILLSHRSTVSGQIYERVQVREAEEIPKIESRRYDCSVSAYAIWKKN